MAGSAVARITGSTSVVPGADDRLAAAQGGRLLGGDGSARVAPSHAWWSVPTLVSSDTAGSAALVASQRPPRPASSTATSTSLPGEMEKGRRRSASRSRRGRESGRARSGGSRRRSGAIASPPTLMRSSTRRGAARCTDPRAGGEPGAHWRAALPSSPCRWCPSTRADGHARSGCPSSARAWRIRSRPGSMLCSSRGASAASLRELRAGDSDTGPGSP